MRCPPHRKRLPPPSGAPEAKDPRTSDVYLGLAHVSAVSPDGGPVDADPAEHVLVIRTSGSMWESLDRAAAVWGGADLPTPRRGWRRRQVALHSVEAAR